MQNPGVLGNHTFARIMLMNQEILSICSCIVALCSVVVAAVIGFATIWLNRKQTEISEQQKEINKTQRDIAAEKLKRDTFHQRFAVYKAFLMFIDHVLMGNQGESSSHSEMTREFNKKALNQLHRSEFLFPREVTAYLDRLYQSLCKCDRMRDYQPADYEIATKRLKEEEPAKLNSMFRPHLQHSDF